MSNLTISVTTPLGPETSRPQLAIMTPSMIRYTGELTVAGFEKILNTLRDVGLDEFTQLSILLLNGQRAEYEFSFFNRLIRQLEKVDGLSFLFVCEFEEDSDEDGTWLTAKWPFNDKFVIFDLVLEEDD